MTRQELHRLLKQSKDIYQLLTDLFAAKQAYYENKIVIFYRPDCSDFSQFARCGKQLLSGKPALLSYRGDFGWVV